MVCVAAPVSGLIRLSGRSNSVGPPRLAGERILRLTSVVLVGGGIGAVATAVGFAVCAVDLGDAVTSRCSGFGSEPLHAFVDSAVPGLGVVAATVAVSAHLPIDRSWPHPPLRTLPLPVKAKRVDWIPGKLRSWLRGSRRNDATTFWSGALLPALALHLVRVVRAEPAAGASG